MTTCRGMIKPKKENKKQKYKFSLYSNATYVISFSIETIHDRYNTIS